MKVAATEDDDSYGWEPIFCSSLREAYYDVIDKIPNNQWKEFARKGLCIDESVIDNIRHDNPHNVREQQFQMCRKWGEMECVDDGPVDEDHLEIVSDTMRYLYQILNNFLLGNKYPKPERKKLSKRKRFNRNYCYRVSKVAVTHHDDEGKRFLGRYDIESGSRQVVIFNNTFTHSAKFVPRLGTEFDVANMKNLWLQLGCKVAVHKDFTAIDMTNKLKHYAATWCDIDYCVVIIMSHGDKGDVIYGESYEGEDSVCANDIVDIFSTTNAELLAGVPKLFFFECSRGGKVGSTDLNPTNAKPADIWDMPLVIKRHDKPINKRPRAFTIESPAKENSPWQFADLPSQNSNDLKSNDGWQSPDYRMPPLSDMLMCFSTAPGFISFRDPRNGSWFINAVTNIFMTHASQQHVVSLMIKVGEAMLEKSASEKHVDGQKCISHFECTLKKELYLVATPAPSNDRQHTNPQRNEERGRSEISKLDGVDTDERSSQTDRIEQKLTATAGGVIRNGNSQAFYQTLLGILGGFVLTMLYRYFSEVLG